MPTAADVMIFSNTFDQSYLSETNKQQKQSFVLFNNLYKLYSPNKQILRNS